jgi:hypothetical protein
MSCGEIVSSVVSEIHSSLDRSPHQSEVTEELVVTASDELSISRRLVYLLVGNLLTAATGFANGAAS